MFISLYQFYRLYKNTSILINSIHLTGSWIAVLRSAASHNSCFSFAVYNHFKFRFQLDFDFDYISIFALRCLLDRFPLKIIKLTERVLSCSSFVSTAL